MSSSVSSKGPNKKKNKPSVNESSTLSLSLDIDNIGITSIPYEKHLPLDQYVAWYAKKYLGNFINDEFDLYFYEVYGSIDI